MEASGDGFDEEVPHNDDKEYSAFTAHKIELEGEELASLVKIAQGIPRDHCLAVALARKSDEAMNVGIVVQVAHILLHHLSPTEKVSPIKAFFRTRN